MRSAARTRVLIVEDDESTRWLLGMFLQKSFSDFDFFYADSAKAGVEFLGSASVDLVVCDYNMNDGLGTEVLKHLRNIKSSTPFILYTSEELQRIPHISYLRFSYIQKPEIDSLMLEIAHQLRK